ncbi:hypothetical protein KR018_004492, partial [Drosophila ironensis]
MAAFLERRCRMNENMESALVAHTPGKQVGKSNIQHHHTLITTTSNTSSCMSCDSVDHFISKCPNFLALNPASRYREAKRLQLCLNCLHKGHSVQNCKGRTCRQCSSKHNSLLHMAASPNMPETLHQVGSSGRFHQDPSQDSSADGWQNTTALLSTLSPPSAPERKQSDYVLLATAVVYVASRSGALVPCRVLLDSCAQINIVTSRLVKQLQLKCNPSLVSVSGICGSSQSVDRTVDLTLQSRDKKYRSSISAVLMPTITSHQPQFDLDVTNLKIPKNLVMADPTFYKSQKIDLLLGASIFYDLLCVGQIRLAAKLPLLQKTRLGWIVSGCIPAAKAQHVALAASIEQIAPSETDSLPEILKRFWEVDNYCGSPIVSNDDDALCEQLFQSTYSRLNSGQYCVRLPSRTSFDMLGDSRSLALCRLKGLERKFAKNPAIKSQYVAFMKEYIDLGHMSISSRHTPMPQYFLPHHCVHKLDSTTTKLRVVFDGSAKSTSGYSLNDLLFTGPSIQPKIFSTLLRFRSFRVALCGDICKMYRCVRVAPPDHYLQSIMWRDNTNEEIKEYTLNTVTYGTRPAAFLAIRAMQQLSYDEEEAFPIAA